MSQISVIKLHSYHSCLARKSFLFQPYRISKSLILRCPHSVQKHSSTRVVQTCRFFRITR